MDSELKRRLVGTVIIVSLVVIFVPMLFEDKDDLTQDSRETSIPEFPRDFDSQVIPLPEAVPDAKSAKESAAEPMEEPDVAPAARRDDALDPLDVPARKTADAAEEESAAPPADEEDFPKPPTKLAPVPVKPGLAPVTPVAKPAAKPSAETAAKSVSETAPTVKAPSQEAPSPKQTVPPKPVKKKTITTTAPPKPPTPSKTVGGGVAREAADGGQAGTARHELKPVPTAQPPAAVKPAPAAPTPPASSGAGAASATPSVAKEQTNLSWWMIQAGSFDDEANAKNLKTRLLQAKIPAFSEKITAPNGVVKYRVRVGPEKERAKAEEILKRMESEAGVKGMIVSYP